MSEQAAATTHGLRDAEALALVKHPDFSFDAGVPYLTLTAEDYAGSNISP
jgi:hypothetical protein